MSCFAIAFEKIQKIFAVGAPTPRAGRLRVVKIYEKPLTKSGIMCIIQVVSAKIIIQGGKS